MKIAIGNIYTKVTECEEKEHRLLELLLTCEVPNYRFTNAYKEKKWDGKKRFYSRDSQVFLTGFLPAVLRSFHKRKWCVRGIDTRKNLVRVLTFNKSGLRDYQISNVCKFASHKIVLENVEIPWVRGVLKMPTRSGKTATISRLIDSVEVPTLYVVERLDALYQTQEEFQHWSDLPTGLIGDGVFQPATVTFCMIQTLHHRLSDTALLRRLQKDKIRDRERENVLKNRIREWQEFLQTVQCLIFDECHKVSSNDYHKVGLKCVNASIRIGISGTPLSRSDIGDVVLVGETGEIVAETSRKFLEDQGYVAKARVMFFPITSPVREKEKYPTAYKTLLVENDLRNRRVVEHTQKLLSMGCTIFILTRLLYHGKILMSMLRKAGVDAVYVSGKDKTSVRREVLANMVTKYRVVVVSTIFDDSINVQDADGAIVASGGMSKIRSIQRSSRVLTAKSFKKNVGWIIDYMDKTNKHLLNHSLARLDAYREEGFQVRIMK